ncbi:torsin-1B-like [Puntigrus tetrazona]|uniref:torsin-1B-like n=1 Tax=Puntigrus tetrazona TaxID=1606681 RepID=UPI001C8A4387|nr:torsin-1B-like [Puntigrus tetrazona]
MKVLHLLLFLYAVSNTTLASDDCAVCVGVSLGMVALITPFLIIAMDPLLPFDSKRLKADLRDSLFGQHIATDVVLKAVSTFMTDKNPNKPLVLSFHGTTGTGKNHVAEIIARNIYKQGYRCGHVHIYISEHHFPHKEHTHIYSANLKKSIPQAVYWFPRSMFIFDEADKMDPQLIDAIKPFLDYNARVDGVSFNKAIFIFLSNAGGNVIADVALDFWREGKDRKEIRMNSKELEFKISKNNGHYPRALPSLEEPG